MLKRLLNRDRYLLLLLAGIVGLASCQQAVQPIVTDLKVVVPVYVKSSGARLPGARVHLTPVEEPERGAQITDQAFGRAVFEERIPITGARYVRIAHGPNEQYLSDTAIVHLPCVDTTLNVDLPRILPIACDADDQTAEGIIDEFCIEEKASDTLMSPWFDPVCLEDVSIAVAAVVPPELRVEYLLRNVDGSVTRGLTPPVAVPNGGQLGISVVYTPQGSGSDEATFDLAIRGNVLHYVVKASASKCHGCDCPESDYQVRLDKRSDLVCIGSTKDFELDLSSVRNEGERECTYEFFNLDGFESGVQLLDFSGSALPGGSSLGKARIRFSPTQAKEYNTTARFGLRTRDRNGRVQECDKVLRVQFLGTGTGPRCRVVPAPESTLLAEDDSPIGKINLSQCIDRSSNSKSLVIENLTDCPTNATIALETPGRMWKLSQSSVALGPKEKTSVDVTFLPTLADVPVCDPNPKLEWTNRVIVTGCTNESFPIRAFADTRCEHYLDVSLTKVQDRDDDLGIFINTEESVVEKRAGGPADWMMYLSDITPTSAQLEARRGTLLRKVGTGGLPAGSNRKKALLDLGCNFTGQCGTASDATLTISEGDVILWDYDNGSGDRCGVIFVGKFYDSASGVRFVELFFYYPLQ